MSVNKTVFANKFDGTSKEELTYILFGTEKQLYLSHFLTDDENSFDQVVAISSSDLLFEKFKSSKESLLVSVPVELNTNLVAINNGAKKANNKLILPTQPLGQSLSVVCLLYTSPSPRDQRGSRMPSSA